MKRKICEKNYRKIVIMSKISFSKCVIKKMFIKKQKSKCIKHISPVLGENEKPSQILHDKLLNKQTENENKKNKKLLLCHRFFAIKCVSKATIRLKY